MNASKQELNIYLLRHGETTLPGRLIGKTDPALSEHGWQQMWRAVDGLSIDRVMTSPLQRCQSFAKSFAAEKGIPVCASSELVEIDFGDWDGKDWNIIPQTECESYFKTPWQRTPPNAESLADFDARIHYALDKLSADPQFGNWLLVVHGGVIKSAIAWAMGLSGTEHYCYQRIQIPHASVSRLTISWYHQQRFISLNSINQN